MGSSLKLTPNKCTAQCRYCLSCLQKGEAPEALAASKRELEIKRAGSASKGAKVFYKVTVKVNAFPQPSHATVKLGMQQG